MATPLPSRFQGIPDIIYGTAFKFEKSASLVEAALNAGFRAIDTAGSQSAYREAQVGKGIAAALASGTCERGELYVRTHFSTLLFHLKRSSQMGDHDCYDKLTGEPI